MKTLQYIKIVVCLWGLCVSCDTQQNVINSGVSSPYHDCTILDYLRGDEYNWELTVAMIERAGLQDLFEGRVDSLPEITFFAPPSYCILRYLWDNNMESVDELTPEFCRKTMLDHVVKGKYLRKDIAYRDINFLIEDPRQTGGTRFTSLGGRSLVAYLDKQEYNGVPEAGADIMFLYSFSVTLMVPLATPDIQPWHGVVHALNYHFGIGKI